VAPSGHRTKTQARKSSDDEALGWPAKLPAAASSAATTRAPTSDSAERRSAVGALSSDSRVGRERGSAGAPSRSKRIGRRRSGSWRTLGLDLCRPGCEVAKVGSAGDRRSDATRPMRRRIGTFMFFLPLCREGARNNHGDNSFLVTNNSRNETYFPGHGR
jgi:hypothetical protein